MSLKKNAGFSPEGWGVSAKLTHTQKLAAES